MSLQRRHMCNYHLDVASFSMHVLFLSLFVILSCSVILLKVRSCPSLTYACGLNCSFDLTKIFPAVGCALLGLFHVHAVRRCSFVSFGLRCMRACSFTSVDTPCILACCFFFLWPDSRSTSINSLWIVVSSSINSVSVCSSLSLRLLRSTFRHDLGQPMEEGDFPTTHVS